MNSLVAAKSGSVGRVPSDFVGKLEWLCKFGRPQVMMLGNGWHACIKMNTNSTGTQFEVSSDFALATPILALDQMIERMLAALAALGVSTP